MIIYQKEMDAARDVTRDRNHSTISNVSFQDKAEGEDPNRTNKAGTLLFCPCINNIRYN